jgi:DNA-binding response OmpR family regulator
VEFTQKGIIKMKCKVLIVEDDRDLLARYVKYLTNAGFEVRGVNNGEDALEAIEFFKPDIIIIDVELKKTNRPSIYRNGRELCRAIRRYPEYQLYTSKYIIMISAEYNSSIDIEGGLKDGADFYTARKPESSGEIISIVEALARRIIPSEGPTRPQGDVDWLIVDKYMAIYRHLPEIRVCEQVRRISRTQHLILQHLHEHFGKPCSSFDLGDRAGIGSDRVAVEINMLRRIIKELLGPDLEERKYIDNVRGEGYVLRSSPV